MENQIKSYDELADENHRAIRKLFLAFFFEKKSADTKCDLMSLMDRYSTRCLQFKVFR
jgi:hypothetical protein